MIEAIKKELEPLLLAHEGSVGLYLSGGSDSLLLLNILLDMGAAFDVVTFDHTFSRKQREHIDGIAEARDLRIFSYPPAAMYLIGDGNDKVTLVEEYAFVPGTTIPFLRDCVQHDGRCVYDVEFNGAGQTTPPIGYRLSIFGSRRYDWHYSLGKLLTGNLFRHGEFTFSYPLYPFNKADVIAGLATYDLKPVKLDTGSLPLCTKCLTATENVACPKTDGAIVAPFVWKPTEMLEAFRNKYDRRLRC